MKSDTLKALEPYYAAIRANAAQITSHQEKQTFLKVIYENFYKVYNPKAADRLGVVYTPNEIVRFMVEGADWLCQKHFGKSADRPRTWKSSIPATGTGTFICELLEHFRGQPAKLAPQIQGGAARQRGGDPALLRRQPEHRGDLCGDHRPVSRSFRTSASSTRWTTWRGWASSAGHQHDLFGACRRRTSSA